MWTLSSFLPAICSSNVGNKDAIIDTERTKRNSQKFYFICFCGHSVSSKHIRMIGLPTPIAKFMRPTWGPPGSCGPDGPHVGPMNLAIRVYSLRLLRRRGGRHVPFFSKYNQWVLWTTFLVILFWPIWHRSHTVLQFVFEMLWRLCNGDADPAFDFWLNSYCTFPTMHIPSANLQPHKTH